MAISIDVTRETDHLFVKVEGEYSMSEFEALGDRVAAEAASQGCTRVLVDISAVTGDISVTDTFYLGAYAARIWKRPLRVALVYRADEIDHFFETVATNRAIDTVIVPDIQAGLAWLFQ